MRDDDRDLRHADAGRFPDEQAEIALEVDLAERLAVGARPARAAARASGPQATWSTSFWSSASWRGIALVRHDELVVVRDVAGLIFAADLAQRGDFFVEVFLPDAAHPVAIGLRLN